MSRYALHELDIFYISFDEPNSEANWNRCKHLHPDAKRIHGVYGFDRAHRACALASTTTRLVTIDGDNWLNDNALSRVVDDTNYEDACFSFKSRNLINGLEYGNGGLKVWNREILLNSRTHENSNGTDFCWDILYYQMDEITSTTVQNCTPYQAWRAGYREGVKMSYIDGQPLSDFAENWRKIWKGNLSRLLIWCTVGRDIDNGIWAMLGARQGLHELINGDISHTDINDYGWFANRWQHVATCDPESQARMFARHLSSFDLYIPEFDQRNSQWMKMIYMNPTRQGPMR